MLKNNFTNLRQSIKLKKSGFDEPCLAHYTSDFEKGSPYLHIWEDYSKSQDVKKMSGFVVCLAPLKSQLFKWFMDKGLYCIVYKYHDGFAYQIYGEGLQIIKEPFNTYEEAEDACIDNLLKL